MELKLLLRGSCWYCTRAVHESPANLKARFFLFHYWGLEKQTIKLFRRFASIKKEHGVLIYEEVHPSIQPTDYCEKPADNNEPAKMENGSDVDTITITCLKEPRWGLRDDDIGPTFFKYNAKRSCTRSRVMCQELKSWVMCFLLVCEVSLYYGNWGFLSVARVFSLWYFCDVSISASCSNSMTTRRWKPKCDFEAPSWAR